MSILQRRFLIDWYQKKQDKSMNRDRSHRGLINFLISVHCGERKAEVIKIILKATVNKQYSNKFI